MSLGPRIWPCQVDASDGSLNLNNGLLIVNYAGDPLVPVSCQVYGPDTALLLDEMIAEVVEGQTPHMVAGRHEIRLVGGVSLWVKTEHATCCGSRLRSFNPTSPATSGPRP